ncbi:MAG: L-seryl-tRNA(Sec) selenium transferase [Xanthobacteraceae bacterium]|nr:L-seryl-tRNA(Sec) selenium transferase [Xanthobacteraceae bacterium]
MRKDAAALRQIPSVDEVLKTAAAIASIGKYGRNSVVKAVRVTIADTREKMRGNGAVPANADMIATIAAQQLKREALPKVRPVFNLTGTVLHTNLGRAVLAEAAIDAACVAMREALALEFDLKSGKRGERDALIRDLLCELTGAEDATVVNNNAAAVLLVLNTLAKGKQAIVSRGELIEIGGAFRMPEIMSRAGAKLVEVGTTNRTHEKDYNGAIGPKTGLILKVHTSNYRIEGFTKEVKADKLAAIAAKHKVPLVNDLGAGTLIDLSKYGLSHEPTVAEAVSEGAGLVTFSGDKLLGGPQAGFIVGKKELIEKINKNPMKRALRIDKIRLAALEATLRLYRNPDTVAATLPTLRLLARRKNDIEALANKLLPAVAKASGDAYEASVIACLSQIGSGSLPQETIPSAGIAIRAKSKSGRAIAALADDFRALPSPVVGRIEEQALVFDLRCLENEKGFLDNLTSLHAETS